MLTNLPGCWAKPLYLANRCRTFSPTLCCILKTFVLLNRKQQRELLLFAYFPLRKAKCNSKVGQLFILPISFISWFFHSVYNINFLFVYWCLHLRSPVIASTRLLFLLNFEILAIFSPCIFSLVRHHCIHERSAVISFRDTNA